jgi:hypothetical protein
LLGCRRHKKTKRMTMKKMLLGLTVISLLCSVVQSEATVQAEVTLKYYRAEDNLNYNGQDSCVTTWNRGIYLGPDNPDTGVNTVYDRHTYFTSQCGSGDDEFQDTYYNSGNDFIERVWGTSGCCLQTWSDFDSNYLFKASPEAPYELTQGHVPEECSFSGQHPSGDDGSNTAWIYQRSVQTVYRVRLTGTISNHYYSVPVTVGYMESVPDDYLCNLDGGTTVAATSRNINTQSCDSSGTVTFLLSNGGTQWFSLVMSADNQHNIHFTVPTVNNANIIDLGVQP